MTPQDQLRIDLAAARYQEALEQDDFATMTELWELAANDPEMIAAFQETHAGLMEELEQSQEARTSARLETLVEEHLTGAEVVRPTTGPVTVGDVADELFRHTPDRLSAATHQMNERLRSARDPLPVDLGLTNFIAWAEEKYGAAPVAYWKAFREAANTLELRRAAEVEYQLAARRAPKPDEGKK